MFFSDKCGHNAACLSKPTVGDATCVQQAPQYPGENPGWKCDVGLVHVPTDNPPGMQGPAFYPVGKAINKGLERSLEQKFSREVQETVMVGNCFSMGGSHWSCTAEVPNGTSIPERVQVNPTFYGPVNLLEFS